MMQRNLSVVFALLCSLSLIAQDKALKGIERSYNKAKYDRCIAMSLKKARKLRKDARPYTYAGLSLYQLSLSAERQTTKAKYLKRALSYLAKAKARDKSGASLKPFQKELGNIHQLCSQLAEDFYNDKKLRAATGIYALIARAYGDTLPKYKQLLAAKQQTKQSALVSKKEPEKKAETSSLKFSRNDLVKNARSFVGVKYRWGGEGPGGFDCSGFTTYLYRKAGLSIPHNAQRQSELGKHVNMADARPGDLIFFGKRYGASYNVSHTGMVYSNEEGKIMIIHCPNRGVTIEGDGDVSWDKYWKKKYLFTKQLI